ncbi:MAG: hypothetical protein JKY71_02770 [Alphaproteobacteria bacterium]|nr:hypothetical protein [Alphaproteobacteria bacterium]
MSDELSPDEEAVVLGVEMVDREERKALRKAQKEAEKAAKAKKDSQEPDEIEQALANSRLAEQQRQQRKKYFKYGFYVLGLTFVIWAYDFLFAPYTSDMKYGICKVYLELDVQYPQDLRVSTVDDYGSYVRIWYTQLDAFGEYRMEQIQCNYVPDETLGMRLDKVAINRREVDPAKVEAFNRSIPVIRDYPPSLVVPPPLPDSLSGLQINTDAFRFQLNVRGLN